jgi:hypothetical protein
MDWVSSPTITVDVNPGSRAHFVCSPAMPEEKPSFAAGLRALKGMTVGRKKWIALRQVESPPA